MAMGQKTGTGKNLASSGTSGPAASQLACRLRHRIPADRAAGTVWVLAQESGHDRQDGVFIQSELA